jgi:hypothetical protein
MSIGLRLSDWQHLTSDIPIVSDLVESIALKMAIGLDYRTKLKLAESTIRQKKYFQSSYGSHGAVSKMSVIKS